MNYSNLTHTGGLPLTQNRIDFLQQSYLAAFAAIARLCGDKSILYGVVNTGGVVSDGWISYNGELLPFVGGAYAAEVVISNTATAFTFADASSHDVEYTRYATCGVGGAFNFSELLPIHSLMNMWMPGDIKERYIAPVDFAAYMAANFDIDGYGLNREAGWRLLGAAVPDAEGKMFVNYKAGDAEFGTIAATGGAKTHTLAGNEQGAITAAAMVDDISGGVATGIARVKINTIEIPRDGAGNQAGWGTDAVIPAAAATTAHNNLPPFFVILKLVKL